MSKTIVDKQVVRYRRRDLKILIRNADRIIGCFDGELNQAKLARRKFVLVLKGLRAVKRRAERMLKALPR